MENLFELNGNLIEINKDITLDTESKIANFNSIIKDKTLLFSGGQIISTISKPLIGNNTRIIVPIPYQIFSGKIDFDGYWLMDRAYPQWFGAIAYKTRNEALSGSSSEDAINKAIKLKKVGEVYIPRGVYLLKSTVKMPAGIQLIGEIGMRDGLPDYSGNTGDCGTILFSNFDVSKYKSSPKEDVDSAGNNNYVLEINTCYGDSPKTDGVQTGLNWYYNHPGMGTLIKNIHFYNEPNIFTCKGEDNQNIHTLLKCVLVFGGAMFDCVEWKNYGQAVRFGHFYSDSKAITNCTVQYNSKDFLNIDENLRTKLYAFDMGWLGDALLFQHNHVGGGEYNKGLRVSNCGRGSIDANIICADVRIENSKGIKYSSNHMETGAKLEIKQSNVTTSNNYFWRGKNPAVSIVGGIYSDSSIVTMNGDLFLFYDSTFYVNKNSFEEFVPVCDYDIAIDKFTILNISNEFRYRVDTGFGTIQTFGINIGKQELISENGKEEVKPILNDCEFSGFNRYSYALSQLCCIKSGFHADSQFSINYPTSQIWFSLSKNNNTIWTYLDGIYSYEIQFYWDNLRNIVFESNEKSLFPIKNRDTGGTTVALSEYKANVSNHDNRGIIISFSGFEIRSGTNIRLIRKRYNSQNLQQPEEVQFVDIPLCGATMLFDNGNSISGFGWKDASSYESAILKSNNGIHKAEYHGDNITCYSTSNDITGSGWITGDTIINIGSNTSWTIKTIK